MQTVMLEAPFDFTPSPGIFRNDVSIVVRLLGFERGYGIRKQQTLAIAKCKVGNRNWHQVSDPTTRMKLADDAFNRGLMPGEWAPNADSAYVHRDGRGFSLTDDL